MTLASIRTPTVTDEPESISLSLSKKTVGGNVPNTCLNMGKLVKSDSILVGGAHGKSSCKSIFMVSDEFFALSGI